MKSLKQFSNNLISALILNGWVAALAVQAYEPPIGIPAPPFGIDEPTPAQPSEWPSAPVPGFYYIDNTHGSATDSSNEYGYPDKPRMSLPQIGTWPAGTYVEVHGGPYTSPSQYRINTNGTASNPTWLIGDSANPPRMRTELIPVETSYLVVEHLHFDTDRKWVRLSGPSNNFVLRYCELEGNPNATRASSLVSIRGNGTRRATDTVIYKNHIHDAGRTDGVEEVDLIGVSNGEYNDRTWVLENHIHDLGGDSVRVGTNERSMTEPGISLPSYTYIGRNHFHDNGENAIDVKNSRLTVISENDMHGFAPVVSSSGEVVVIHERAEQVWVIMNQVHDGAIGLIDTIGRDVWFIGNEIYDINHDPALPFDPSNSGRGPGTAMLFRGNSSGGAINNTLYNVDKGIAINGGRNYAIAGNIFAKRAEPAAFDISYGNTSLEPITEQDWNFFSDFEVQVGTSRYSTLAGFRNRFGGKAVNAREGNPGFIDADWRNFRLSFISEVIDAGFEHPAFQLFEDQFGIDIRKDIRGAMRPQGATFDMGAVEYPTRPRPAEPTGLSGR